MKKFCSALLVIALICSIIVMPVKAEENAISIAQKTATPINEKGRYEVEVQVPGEDGKSYHDEIIVMVDGSYSTDDDWNVTRQVIMEIGKTVLEGSGNTLLTVMTFGMGDNIVLKHVESVSELDATLTELPGGLLYGRSSTNCEAGFTGIGEYINNHDETLNEVHVVYITDGEINTDETEYVFADWTKNTWLKKDPITLVKWALADECGFYGDGLTNLSNAYKTVFGETIYTPEQVATEGVISEEDLMAWAEQVWKDVYEYSRMELENAYTVSDAERAFVKYDKENGTHVQEMFYYALWGRSYPNRATRTPAAGLALAADERVAHLYMVDSNKATPWMSEMTASASNVSFYESGSTKNLLATIESILTNLAYTPYNDVVVTDYMSKWVNLDQTTIKVVDNYAEQTIWTSKEGWLITENRPTSQEVPVVVEEVPTDAYADGGPDVVGNENGTIYKLKWYVKDGAMLRNHNFSLVYEVDVDIDETGFEYDTNYPANGNTIIEYTEKNGDEITEVTEDIDVPDVIVDKPETVKISVTKIWEDEDNKYGERPESITINLMADGVKIAEKTVTAEDNWTYSFEEVFKYDAEGKEIVYTISEEEVEGYETTINGYDITNTYVKPEVEPEPESKPESKPEPEPEPETVNINGTKTWEDEDNKYGKRPESITINLMADGVKIAEKTVTAEDNWTYSFENMLKYNAEGNEIVYTVSEEEVEGYETTVNGYDITNTYVKTEEEPEKPTDSTTKPEDPEENVIPATGDNSNIYWYAILAVISGTAFVIMTVIGFKNKKNVIR